MAMYEFARLGGALLTPLTLAFGLWLAAALCAIAHRRRAALACAVCAVAWLWLVSTPLLARVLGEALQRPYPMLAARDAPAADAIVVLGGAVGGIAPQRPGIVLTPAASRVWHAAALYRAGKAKWVVVAAGGDARRGEQVEADAMAELLITLGVPDQVILREKTSRSTLQNARNTLPILQSLGARSVLLVTSGQHMARAIRTFTFVWNKTPLHPVASTSDSISYNEEGWTMWFPTAFALENITKAFKEFSGMAVLAIMRP